MGFIAAIEVDQRQRIVTSADKLKEMLGGSWTIEETGELARKILGKSEFSSKVTEIRLASGDIWLRADVLDILEKCLWRFRQEIVHEMRLPCSFAVVQEDEDLEKTRRKLTLEIRRVKDNKVGEVGHVSLPWLAPCGIQPELYANQWHPAWDNPRDQHYRRALISDDSVARLKRGKSTLDRYYGQFSEVQRLGLETPETLDDFAPQGDSSYLALIRLDVDKAGKLFEGIRLKKLDAVGGEVPSWEPLLKCSEAFEQCLREAREYAFTSTIRKAHEMGVVGYRRGSGARNPCVPISPLIAAGDDLLVVLRKELAVPFAISLMTKHKEIAGELFAQYKNPRVPFSVTLSGAIVFARAGFPFSVLSELSVEVEHSAKELRKSPGIDEPCLDVYWLESTGRESAMDARKEGLMFCVGDPPDGAVYSFITRPWTLTQADAMWRAATEIAEIPRSKWHQLLEGLHQGDPFGTFHYRRWLQHLGAAEQARMGRATAMLQEVGLWSKELDTPWRQKDGRSDTPLLELHQLREMAGQTPIMLEEGLAV